MFRPRQPEKDVFFARMVSDGPVNMLFNQALAWNGPVILTKRRRYQIRLPSRAEVQTSGQWSTPPQKAVMLNEAVIDALAGRSDPVVT